MLSILAHKCVISTALICYTDFNYKDSVCMQELSVDIQDVKEAKKTLTSAVLRLMAAYSVLTAVWILFLSFAHLLPGIIADTLPMLLIMATLSVFAVTVRAAAILKPRLKVIRNYKADISNNPQQVRIIITYAVRIVSAVLISVCVCLGIAAIPTLIYTSQINSVGGNIVYILYSIYRVLSTQGSFTQFVIAAGIIIDAVIFAKLISHCVKVFSKNTKTAAK